MKHTPAFILAIFLTISAATAWAQGPTAFERALAAVTYGGGAVRADSLQSESEVMAMRADNVLAPPTAEWSGLWGTPGAKWDLSVSMAFDWPGLYGARRRTADARQKTIDLKRRLDIIDRAMEGRRALIQLVGVRQEMELNGSLMALNDSLLTAYERAYKHGECTMLEINRLKIEILNLEAQYSELYTRRAELETSLTAMNPNADIRPLLADIADYPEEPLLAQDAYEAYIERANPMTDYYAGLTAVADNRAEVARMGRYPGFEAGYTHEYELGERFNGFKVAVTLPFTYKKYGEQAARLEAESYRERAEQTRLQQLSLMRSAYQEALRLQRQVAQYGDALDSADNVALLGKALRGGQLTLLQYLQEVAYFTDARRSLITARQAYHQALATLWRYTL